MVDLFKYDDFRKFLEDYYADMKAKCPYFSYKYLAQKAGFRNKGFVFNIIKGKKNLSASNAVRLAKALKFSRQESEYFGNLTAYNQARGPEEQGHFYSRMLAVNGVRNGRAGAQVVRRDQYEFYSKWHHAAVRSLIDMNGFDGDFKGLAKKLHPPIQAREAKKSVELLLRLGMVVKAGKDSYRVATKTITTGPDIPRTAVLKFHEETLKLAGVALKELPREKRNISGCTLGISEAGYQAICEEIREFRKRLLSIAEKDEKADRVYQMNCHFFPLTNNTSRGI